MIFLDRLINSPAIQAELQAIKDDFTDQAEDKAWEVLDKLTDPEVVWVGRLAGLPERLLFPYAVRVLLADVAVGIAQHPDLDLSKELVTFEVNADGTVAARAGQEYVAWSTESYLLGLARRHAIGDLALAAMDLNGGTNANS